MSLKRRAIHLTAVATDPQREVKRLGLRSAQDLVRLVQEHMGERYQVRGNPAILEAEVDERHGGRKDDAARARELEGAFRDDRVLALITLRGGAWFTRILPLVDFELLKHRRKKLYIFGFSEMTGLINIAGSYRQAVGVYDLGPGFLFAGRRDHATRNATKLSQGMELEPGEEVAFGIGWSAAGFRGAFLEFVDDAIAMAEGRGSARMMTGRVLQGRLPAHSTAKVIGGNLSVLIPLLASQYARRIDPTGKWLALEDIDENVERVDRMLAALRLAGVFDKIQGLFLGDFHTDQGEITERVTELLKYHLGKGRRLPVVRLNELGHIWPISPLPMHRPITIRCGAGGRRSDRVRLEVDWAGWSDAEASG